MATSPNSYHSTEGSLAAFGTVDSAGLTDPEVSSYGITTRHWKDQSLREFCFNSSCKARFTLFNRHHHCRRCGEVFCAECLKYQRRLNLLAHPDPNGKLYKVCQSCFDKGPQSLGQTRSLLEVYRWYRGQGQGHPQQGQGHPQRSSSLTERNGVKGVTISTFRERLDLPSEKERLRRGFEENVRVSGFKRALSGLVSVVTVPEWQKAPYHVYGKMAKTCSGCEKSFGLTRAKQLCVVCGSAVCRGGDSRCSNSDLIVYVPDGAEDVTAEISVVKIVGCPSSEPAVCEYLRICAPCRQALEDMQVAEYHRQRPRKPSEDIPSEQDDFWSRLEKVNSELAEIQRKVDDQLPKYQELIDVLEASGGSNKRTETHCQNRTENRRVNHTDKRSNMQVLAKAQGDIGDHLTMVAMKVQLLRKLGPQTQTQLTILNNLIKSKCEYYQENMFLFRSLRRKLETVTPPEVLEFVQSTVDRNAINSCYIAVRQLALEVLHLVTTHQLGLSLVTQLAQVEEVVQCELQRSVLATGETWEDHSAIVNDLIQQRLANKSRRIVNVSSRRVKKYGRRHVVTTITERVSHTLSSVHLQLDNKCAHKSFTRTKDKVKVTGDWLKVTAWAEVT